MNNMSGYNLVLSDLLKLDAISSQRGENSMGKKGYFCRMLEYWFKEKNDHDSNTVFREIEYKVFEKNYRFLQPFAGCTHRAALKNMAVLVALVFNTKPLEAFSNEELELHGEAALWLKILFYTNFWNHYKSFETEQEYQADPEGRIDGIKKETETE